MQMIFSKTLRVFDFKLNQTLLISTTQEAQKIRKFL